MQWFPAMAETENHSMDYLDNNRLIAHYCGFDIMELLPAVALAAVLSGFHSYRASKSFRRGA